MPSECPSTCCDYAYCLTAPDPSCSNAPAICVTDCQPFGHCCSASVPHGGASVRKDPHLRLAHGGRTDIRGEDRAVYNFLSAANVSLNVQFATSDFHWHKRLVHGTKLTAAAWTLRTSLSGRLVHVEFDAPNRTAATSYTLQRTLRSTWEVAPAAWLAA